MKITALLFVPLLLMPGCASLAQQPKSLTEARQGFKTTLVPQPGSKDPVEPAPPQIFRAVKYPSAEGALAAYLSPDPGDGKKHPAIIWITGGDCNSIGDVWTPSKRSNDQTASPYRKAGIVMMFPSLRGGNDGPGAKEGFLGEVDDVLAAEKYLEQQPYVDPKRIYLGGHSTGGTLTMLVAETSTRFRDVFSYGPVANVAGYGADSGFLPFDITNKQEVKMRSPGFWLSSIHSPIWVFEGSESPGNIRSLQIMDQINHNSQVHFIPIQGATHFTDLAPTNELIAKKIVQDTGTTTNISFTEDEVSRNFAQSH